MFFEARDRKSGTRGKYLDSLLQDCLFYLMTTLPCRIGGVGVYEGG